MKKTKSIREILSERSFATVDCDNITGERKDTIIDGHKIVTGHHFLAEFEIDILEKEIRARIANGIKI